MMPAGSVLSVYLASDLKSRWRAHCRQQGETPSSGVRQVIEHLLANDRQPYTQAEVVRGHEDRTRRRLEFRLTESELAKVCDLARIQGLSTNQWVVSLVRAHLTKQPQFGMVELTALGDSNSRLLSIGRNLNQIARRLNAGEIVDELPSIEQMRALGGYSGLTGAAQTVYAKNHIYDACQSVQSQDQRSACEAAAAKPSIDQGMALDAYAIAASRLDQIEQLSQRINGTKDPKAIAELQGRIASEEAAIQNEQTKLQLYQMVADAQTKIQEQRQRELNQRDAARRGYVQPQPLQATIGGSE